MLIQASKTATLHGSMPWATDVDHLGPSAAFQGDVAVMPATVLGLELLLQESFIDLRMASELVLSDVGATVQILRLIDLEYELAEDRPHRMEDCIASLDVDEWFNVISARTFAGENAEVAALWNHSRLIAQYSQLIGESLEGICMEEAYLVGLLHEFGASACVLRSRPHRSARTETSARTDAKHSLKANKGIAGAGKMNADTSLAVEWSLPSFVLAALPSLVETRISSIWRSILSAAHKLAGTSTDFDASAIDEIGPTLQTIREALRKEMEAAHRTPAEVQGPRQSLRSKPYLGLDREPRSGLWRPLSMHPAHGVAAFAE